MFESVREEVKRAGETLQISISSDKLVPGISDEGGRRVFTLEYGGTKYPCLFKAWSSWVDRILKPEVLEDAPEKSELIDEMTGRKKRWSTATIRKFLDWTDPSIAQKVVREWWENSRPQKWNVIKYKDNGSPGDIRYIGTDRYALYKHEDFLDKLTLTDFGPMMLQQYHVNENRMVLRITEPEPLPIPGSNLYAGYHVMNSENGSSSILVKYLIFDLLCTNGLMIVLDSNIVFIQKHSSFDGGKFSDRLRAASKTIPELHARSTEAIRSFIEMGIEREALDSILKFYGKEYDASQKFLDAIKDRAPITGWGLVSAITEVAQSYSWDTRMGHELHAAKLMSDIQEGKHLR